MEAAYSDPTAGPAETPPQPLAQRHDDCRSNFMPGIAGLISRRHPGECIRLVETMTASMQHEKFHVAGTSSAPELAVFGGWVALENSFAQSQPLMNERADVILLVAGECFVDAEVSTQLKAPGHRPEESRAAWMARLYEENGVS